MKFSTAVVPFRLSRPLAMTLRFIRRYILKVKAVVLTTVSALLLGVSQPAIASASPTFSPGESITPFAKTKFSWRAKCPVERIANQTIVGYIYGYGRTKAAATADANAQVNSKYGKGYRLHHCTPKRFEGSGGSSPFSDSVPA